MIKSLSDIRVLDRLCNLLNVQTPGGGVDDILVDAALFVDFVGVAALLHTAILERVDVVGVDNLRDAVRDDDDGAVFLDSVDAVLDLLGGDGVETGRRLVQEDDGRVLEEHTGDGHALLLPAGEVGSVVRELLRQLHHLVIKVRLLGRLHHLFVRGVGVAVKDVLLDGAVENMVLLQHQADVLAQVLRVVVAQVNTVEGNGAHLRLVELVEQVDDGALTRAGETHQGGDFARFNLHIDAKQRLRAVRVGEVHSAQLEVAVDLLGTMVARRLDFLLGVEDAEEALRVDQRVVHVVENALQLGDGGNDVAEQHHVVHNLTDGHTRILAEHQVGGEDDDQNGADLLDKALKAVVVEGDLTGLHLVLGHLVLDIQLFLGLNLFAVETLDDVDGVDDVLDALALAFQMRPHFAAPPLEPTRLAVGDPEIDGHDAEGHESHIDIGGEHQDQGEQGAGEQRQQVDEEVLHGARQRADALVDTGLEFAGGVVAGVEKGDPEGEHLLDNALSQVAADVDAHPLAEVVLCKGDQGGEHLFAQQHNADDGHNAGRLSPAEVGADERVDGIHGTVEHDGVDLRH